MTDSQPALIPGLEATPPLPANLNAMHAQHGIRPGYVCGDCRYLARQGTRRYWYKCSRARMSASATTDFCRKWPACGLFRSEPL